MGPRSIERGNTGSVQLTGILVELQWGRARLSAEIRRSDENLHTNRHASMGPRSIERGNVVRHRWNSS